MPKNWNCFVAGCTSNYTSKVSGLKYFRIPKKSIKFYDAFFKTEDVNWETAFICSLHWSKGRKNFQDLPDIRIPTPIGTPKGNSSTRKPRKTPYERSAKRSKARRSLDKQLAEVKLRVSSSSREKKDLEDLISQLESKVASLEHQNDILQTRSKNLRRENVSLLSEVSILKKDILELEKVVQTLKEEVRIKSFNWLDIESKKFVYLCGIRRDDFVTIFRCFKPFLGYIRYEGCKTSEGRSLSKENELLVCFIICRHALHLGVMAWVLGLSESTVSRIFEAWMTFGHSVFSKLDLSHPKSLIENMMPKAYKNLNFSHIVLVIDATEFKVSGFTNLELNQLFFSDYKNSHTVKALPCLTPHGSACLIPNLYPGSITDSMLTEMVGALDNMICHDGVLTDKGFAISELAAEKGAIHNRPPMKSADQFTTGECDANFKIACLRIHVERWIGCVRDFAILNAVWPSSRIDLLNSVWVFLANIVNITSRVGPKE